LTQSDRPGEIASSDAGNHATVVHGFEGGAENPKRQWFEKVYTGRGDRMHRLTWRAVLTGTLLDGVLSLTNLYVPRHEGRLGLRRRDHRVHPHAMRRGIRSCACGWRARTAGSPQHSPSTGVGGVVTRLARPPG